MELETKANSSSHDSSGTRDLTTEMELSGLEPDT